MVLLTALQAPTDGVRHKQEGTSAHVQGRTLESGTLYIAESRVSWLNPSGNGFFLEYPSISLHAVSRDTNSFPQECLYLMTDIKLEDLPAEEDKAAENGGESDDDSTDPITEIRFIPEDKAALDGMYKAMCDCQALHPDPEDSFSGEDDDEDDEEGVREGVVAAAGDFFQSPEDVVHLNAEGQATLQRLEAMLAGSGAAPPANGAEQQNEEEMDTGQFEDA